MHLSITIFLPNACIFVILYIIRFWAILTIVISSQTNGKQDFVSYY